MEISNDTSPATDADLFKSKLTLAAQKESLIEYSADKPRPKKIFKSGEKIKGRGQVNVYNGSKGVASGQTSRVQLFVSAKNLADLDFITQSDPYCTLKVKNSKHGSYIEYGKTEMIDNNLNPKWVKHFTVQYFFEGTQWLCFEVWDDDEEEAELIGMAELRLSEVMNAPGQKYCCPLTIKKYLRGTLKIKADSVNISQDKINLQFGANLVSKKYFCCGYDNPYLLIERARLLNETEYAEKQMQQREALK